MRYKFNYAVKALFAFGIYSNVQTYQKASAENFLIEKEKSNFRANILLSSGAFMGTCLLI
tara:strand:+ start:210 stop:389 length:180 start_codon:yes stop_codon:yes gene_type:complete